MPSHYVSKKQNRAYKKEEANIRDKNIKIIIVCNGRKFKYKSTSYVKKAIHKRIIQKQEAGEHTEENRYLYSETTFKITVLL